MTQYNSKEFAQQKQETSTASHSKTAAAAAATTSKVRQRNNCDILLNNFQIKKKRYRVLLNYDHIVWERLDAKRNNNKDGHNNKEKSVTDNATTTAPTAAAIEKETEFESEQLANRAAYGHTSNVVHINEIIKVTKGTTKAATLRITSPVAITRQQSNFATTSSQQHNTAQATTSAAIHDHTPSEQFITIHYAEQLVKSETDCNRWVVHKLTLYNADTYVIRQWHELLTQLLDSQVQRMRVRRLLVFINPYGGRKSALSVYERYCKPVFQLADIDASCIITQRANQIHDILTSHDLSPYDAIACVGGDGTVAEVINGLIFRRIRDLNMDLQQPAYIPKPTLPISVIPAGSTDTIAYSMHGTSDARTAAIHLVLGQRRGLDVSSVSNRQGLLRFCASIMSYGYLGDVAVKSEKYRWMGTKRYEYTGFKQFITNRGYEAEINMLVDNEAEAGSSGPESEAATASANVAFNMPRKCYAHCGNCKVAAAAAAAVAAAAAALEQQACGKWTKSMLSNETLDDNNVSDVSSEGGVPQHNKNDTTTTTTKTPTVNELNRMVAPFIAGNGDDDDNKANVTVDTMQNLNNKDDCDRNVKAVMLHHDAMEKDKQIQKLLNDIEVPEHQLQIQQCDIKPANVATQAATTYKSNTSSSTSNNSSMQWHTIKGKFFMICAANITCASSRSPNGMASYSHLGDGYLDLILVRQTSLLRNLGLLKETMGRNGDIRNLPFVEMYRTRKFYFRTPYTRIYDNEDYSVNGSCQPIAEAFAENDATNHTDNVNVSSWNCDGEVVRDLDIIMSSHCQLIDVFMRGPYNYKKSANNTNNFNICSCCCSTN